MENELGVVVDIVFVSVFCYSMKHLPHICSHIECFFLPSSSSWEVTKKEKKGKKKSAAREKEEKLWCALNFGMAPVPGWQG